MNKHLFVSLSVYQSLIRTCWHPVVLVTEEQATQAATDSELKKTEVSYKDYLYFWKCMLSSTDVKVSVIVLEKSVS